MHDFNPLTEFRISHFTTCIVAAAIFSNFFFIALLAYLMSRHSHYQKGFTAAKEKFNGKLIQLDSTWIGRTIWPNRVFTQNKKLDSTEETEYVLEAFLELGEDVPYYLIAITKEEHAQLLLEGQEIYGKEYQYAVRHIHPGSDEYYFQRVVARDDGD